MPWKDVSVVRQRRELVAALLARTEAVAVICRRFGVSRPTAYKFLRRFRASGGAGLRDRSHVPVQVCAPQAAKWCAVVLRLRRRHASWGARKLRWLLRQRDDRRGLPAERTVQRWIQQAGLIRRRRFRRRAHAAPGRGTLARRSNMVWTIDLKGWFRTGDGTKIEPLTVRDLWSRYVLWTRPLAPRDEASVRRVCQRLFRRYGRPRVIRCDRGAPFFGDGPHGFTRLSLWWWRQGIRVEFVRRGAINNNAHEQMHRVLKAELAIARTAATQTRRLERWRQRYNEQRPHEALRLRPPAEAYRPRPKPSPKLIQPRYPRHYLQRRVQPNGEISLPGWRGSIGRAFGGLRVGLAPAGPHRHRVYFAGLHLGLIDLNTSRKLVFVGF
jgi:putative transposase